MTLDHAGDFMSSVVAGNLLPPLVINDGVYLGNNSAEDSNKFDLPFTAESGVRGEPHDVIKDADLITRLSNDLTTMSGTLISVTRQMVKTELEAAMSNIRDEIAEKVIVAMRQMKPTDTSEAPVIEHKRRKLVAAAKQANTGDIADVNSSIFPPGIELENIAKGKKAKAPDVPKTAKVAVKVKRVNINGKKGCSSKMAMEAAAKAALLVKKIQKACSGKHGSKGGKEGK